MTLRFAPEVDYGPFVFRAPDGSVQGLSVEILQRAARRAGLRLITLPPAALAENLAAVQRGEVDVLTSLRPTPERAQYLSFSPPYVRVPAVVVTLLNSAKDLPALAGQPVAVGQGYAVEAHVRQRFPAVRWVAVPDDLQALQALHRHEVAAVVADVASVGFLMQRQGWTDLRLGSPVGFDYPLSLAWRKDRPDIGAALERGLRAVPAAEREALLARWLPPQADVDQPASDRNRLMLIALALSLLGAAGWVWLRWRRSPSSDKQAH